MYEYYRAVLGAVREGLLLVDDDLRVQLVNEEARRLLALPDDVEGRSLDDLGLPPGLLAAVKRRTALADQTYVLGQQVLVFSSAPAYWREAEVGAVVTVRDRTELQAVTGELDLVRGLTDSLRAQNHEAANRLHTIVSLVEMGRTEQAVEFATAELEVAQGLDRRARVRRRRARAGCTAARQDRPGGRARHRAGDRRRACPLTCPSARATSSRWSATSSTTPSTPSRDPRRDAAAGAGRSGRRRRSTCTSRSTTPVRGIAPRRPCARAGARLVEQGPGGSRARPGDGRPGRRPSTAARWTSPTPRWAARGSWSTYAASSRPSDRG